MPARYCTQMNASTSCRCVTPTASAPPMWNRSCGAAPPRTASAVTVASWRSGRGWRDVAKTSPNYRKVRSIISPARSPKAERIAASAVPLTCA